jgi:plasmid stabilization system protein ParE
MKLKFSKEAVNDLVRLSELIAQHNPEAAQRVSQRLSGVIERLVVTPQVGRPVSDIPGEIRELILGQYVVRYEVRKQYLYILRIWHGKEDRLKETSMGQVTIYIDKNTEKKMMNMVKKSGISKSKWITQLIREKTSTTWPENVIRLAGAWQDLPTAEEIRANMGQDSIRESI